MKIFHLGIAYQEIGEEINTPEWIFDRAELMRWN